MTFTEYEDEDTPVVGPVDDPDNPGGNTPETEPDDDGETTSETSSAPAVSARAGIDLEILWLRYKVYFIIGFCVIAFCALVYFAIFLFRKSAYSAVTKRGDRIKTIRDDGHYRNSNTDRRADAQYLIDSLFRIFEAVEIGPERGEQLSEFAERLNTEYKGLSTEDPAEVMRCILKEEYGHGLSFKEMNTLASYLEDSIKTIYAGLTRRERIKFRFFKHII